MVAAHRLIGTWSTRITKYIALTEFMRRKFIEAGFAAEQLVVKPNFVAPDPGPGGHRGQYALFVGRICREKGVLTLVRAWERVGPGLTLKIAGQGPLSDLGQVARPGIEWLGHQSHDKVLALMKDATMLVFPAEWYEGFPLTIAEAFATGLPVLASRIGAMAELVDDRRTGLLFTPGDPSGPGGGRAVGPGTTRSHGRHGSSCQRGVPCSNTPRNGITGCCARYTSRDAVAAARSGQRQGQFRAVEPRQRDGSGRDEGGPGGGARTIEAFHPGTGRALRCQIVEGLNM